MSEQPWENEPDQKRWTHDFSGYSCEILRHPSIGHLCGYVDLPDGHPLNGISYSEKFLAPRELIKGFTDDEYAFEEVVTRWVKSPIDLVETSIEGLIRVHGGVTYGRTKDGVTRIGFDCGHAWDVSPKAPYSRDDDSTYRDIEYVTNETESLATQLHEIASWESQS
jgi:hypothetical protein